LSGVLDVCWRRGNTTTKNLEKEYNKHRYIKHDLGNSTELSYTLYNKVIVMKRERLLCMTAEPA